MDKRRVAFCTTCKGRLAHLQRTLSQNIGDNPGALHIVLDYNSRDGLAEWVRHEMRGPISRGQLVYYRFAEPTPFRMAHAKNLAHRLGIREGANVLVNLDADNFTGPGFVDYVAEHVSPERFLWSRMIKEGPNKLDRGISGRIVATAEQFLLAGGYDERYSKWSPDDKDYNQRLRGLGFEAREIDPRYLKAIPHTDKMRFKEYPEAEVCGSTDFALDGSQPRVVNGGRIGCGVVYRNFDPDPIIIGPVPTRVFGIGMHKTGTTSLARALTQLGFPCAHWPSAHWAKRVWTEMSETGYSPTLERHRAATDLPIPLLFRDLDRSYPGSKFVMTLRPEEEWLESVRKHFTDANPWRSAWDTDPFTHRVHTLLYGRRKFDPEIMLARYRRHNVEVREHFRGRSHDLLVLDSGPGYDWHELCAFLGAPIPSGAYPVENRTASPEPAHDWVI